MEQFRNEIEHYGIIMEKMGLPPIAARIYVYLILCSEPGAVFKDLVKFFNVSKSAISNALKLLNSAEMVDSKTIGGQRKRYFFIDFSKSLNEEFISTRFRIVSNMLDELKKVRNINDDFAQELDNASLLYKMLLVEIPIILERWKRTIEINSK